MSLIGSSPIPPFKVSSGQITQRRPFLPVHLDFSNGVGELSIIGAVGNQQLMSFDDGISGGTAFWYSSGSFDLYPTSDASYGMQIAPSDDIAHIYLEGIATTPASLFDGMVWYNSTDDDLSMRFGTVTRKIGSLNFQSGNDMVLGPVTYDGWATYTNAGVPIVGAGQRDLGGGNLANFLQVGVTTGTVGGVIGLYNDTLAGDPDIVLLSSFAGVELGSGSTDTATGLRFAILNGAGGTRWNASGSTGLMTQNHSADGAYLNGMTNSSNGASAITGWAFTNDTGSQSFIYKTSSGTAIPEALLISNEDGNTYVGGVKTAIGSTSTPIVTDANFEGGHSVKVTNANAATYTVDSGAGTDDYIIQSNYTATGAQTITLPAVATNSGRVLIIKDADGNAGANNITIDGNASETIDGATTYVISTNYGSVKIYCDGNEWFTIS